MPRPNFEEMSKEQLITLLDRIREDVRFSEDAGDTCLYLYELLSITREEMNNEA